jgi:signal transduction histidine kinase
VRARAESRDPAQGEDGVAAALRRWRAVPYLVLLVGLLATAVVSWRFRVAARHAEALAFENLATDTEARVRNALGRHITALLGGAALLAFNQSLDADDFRAYARQLHELGGLQGVQGLGFSRVVREDERESFERSVAATVHPDFRVWPVVPGEPLHAILFLEPMDPRNRAAIGFNMFSEPVRRRAMEAARDTGAPAATGKVTLVQEIGGRKQAGMLVYVPVYRGRPKTVEERRQRLVGFVYSPFRMDDLLATVLPDVETLPAHVALYDGLEPSPEAHLYSSGPAPEPAGLQVDRALVIAGHPMLLRLTSAEARAARDDVGLAVGTSLGLLVTGLLFAFTRFQIDARQAAEESARSLREAREEAVRHLRSRDAFLSIASHELKTPLTALQLHVDGLLRGLPSVGTGNAAERERLARRLDSVSRQARRLGALINELLDVSRVTGGHLPLHPEPMDLGELIQEVRGRFEPELARAGCPLSVSVNGPLEGAWDRLRLDQVLTNLLSNALKYGPGKPIEIHASRQDDWVQVIVTDHGMGIDPKDQDRIFERFERAVSDRKFGGFGIGLWIARQIVVSMGGRISVSSRPGAGASFLVELPLRPPATPHPVQVH